ncbi:MAG: DnaJ domain-containing protein, partial [Eubacteriales bacterium]|nr:DnaJ domain-containing protein [Eubacteriales bacterium]
MSDPYKILGISRDATDDEVKKAYRQLSRKYHPDANVNNPNKDKAEEMFKLVQQAYQQVMYERQHPYASSGYGTGSGSYGGAGTSGQQQGYGPRPGAGRPGGSSQTWQDENGTTYTYYGNYQDFSDFWNEFFGAYGFGTQTPPRDESEEAIHLRAAASYINHGMFQEALNVLDAMEERSAQWYYYSAAANSGIGNDSVALEHAQRAAAMEPDNQIYQSMLSQLQSGSRWYTARSQTYGSPVSGGSQCARMCMTYLCFTT